MEAYIHSHQAYHYETLNQFWKLFLKKNSEHERIDQRRQYVDRVESSAPFFAPFSYLTNGQLAYKSKIDSTGMYFEAIFR